LKFPIAPMGKWLTCLPRLSLAQLRLTLRSFTGCTCRRDLNFFHGLHGRLTVCALFCRAAVSMSIPALSQSSTPRFIPIKLPKCVLMLKSSHRPDGNFTYQVLHLCLQDMPLPPPEYDWFSGPETTRPQLAVAWVVMLSFLLLCGSLATAIALTSEDEEDRSVMRLCLMLICILFGVPFLICILLWGGRSSGALTTTSANYVRAHANKVPIAQMGKQNS
jgi:hypothetical protein